MSNSLVQNERTFERYEITLLLIKLIFYLQYNFKHWIDWFYQNIFRGFEIRVERGYSLQNWSAFWDKRKL